MHRLFLLLLLTSLSVFGGARPVPGMLVPDQLEGFADLSPGRQRLVKLALEEASRLKLNKYLYGSHDPKRGGFDCSGSVYYLLKKLGIDPARSSGAQFEWLRKAGTLHEIPAGVRSLDHKVFDDLRPGDLLFWTGSHLSDDGRSKKISHVQIYLGVEKDYGPVMVGSTDGRSYRGTARCGFGVYDFKLPRKTSKARFVGYGRPPGLSDTNTSREENSSGDE